MRIPSSTIHDFILPNSEITKDKKTCEKATNYYEDVFKDPINVYQLHPYTDALEVVWESYDEKVPAATLHEVINIVQTHKKKKSHEAHDLSGFMFSFLPAKYWSLLLKIFNLSLSSAIVLYKWNETRMLLYPVRQNL